MIPVIYVLPSCWASYLINNDSSGIDVPELRIIDKWLESHNLPFPSSCEDVGFRWNHDASSWNVLAADCQYYTFLINGD